MVSPQCLLTVNQPQLHHPVTHWSMPTKTRWAQQFRRSQQSEAIPKKGPDNSRGWKVDSRKRKSSGVFWNLSRDQSSKYCFEELWMNVGVLFYIWSKVNMMCRYFEYTVVLCIFRQVIVGGFKEENHATTCYFFGGAVKERETYDAECVLDERIDDFKK